MWVYASDCDLCIENSKINALTTTHPNRNTSNVQGYLQTSWQVEIKIIKKNSSWNKDSGNTICQVP